MSKSAQWLLIYLQRLIVRKTQPTAVGESCVVMINRPINLMESSCCTISTETLNSWTRAFKSLDNVRLSSCLKVTEQFRHILTFHSKAEYTNHFFEGGVFFHFQFPILLEPQNLGSSAVQQSFIFLPWSMQIQQLFVEMDYCRHLKNRSLLCRTQFWPICTPHQKKKKNE